MASRLLSALAGAAAARPRLVIAAALALALAGAGLALTLQPSAATSTFVGRSSDAYQGTQTFYRHFGEEPIEVLVQGNLEQLLLSSDLERLVGLEGCLSGRVPFSQLAREGGANGPCGQLARMHAVKVVLGPGPSSTRPRSRSTNSCTSGRKASERRAASAKQAVTRAALARGLSAGEAGTWAKKRARPP